MRDTLSLKNFQPSTEPINFLLFSLDPPRLSVRRHRILNKDLYPLIRCF